jgi:hypothetical protein
LYLSDKFKRRGVNVDEYLFLIEFLNEVNPEVIIDVGCFYGVSTYILGTSSKNLKGLFCIENIDSPNFVEYVREGKPIPKSDYGKFKPEGTIFLTHGYENDLPPLLEQHPGAFVFLDSVKLPDRVLDELMICYKGKAKYVAVHDTCKRYKHPRRAVKYVVDKHLFKILGETCIEERNDIKVKGVTILERI